MSDRFSNEMQRYHASIKEGWHSKQDKEKCLCHGNGWILSNCDVWVKCPVHYDDQIHPEMDID